MWREALRIHPTSIHLDAYVDRRLDSRAGARLAAHLLTCAQCRGSVDALNALRGQLAAAPAHGFRGADALQSALARRAAGARVMLPVQEQPVSLPDERELAQRGARRRRFVAIGIAATLVILAGGSPALRGLMQSAGRSSELTSGTACAAAARHEEQRMSVRRMLKVLVVGPALAALGGCEEDRAATAPVVKDFEASRMQAFDATYRLRKLVDGEAVGDAWNERVAVRPATLNGTTAWVVMNPSLVSSATGILDSTYLDAQSLSPLRQTTAAWPDGRWVVEVKDDTVRHVELPGDIEKIIAERTTSRARGFAMLTAPTPLRRSPGGTLGPALLEVQTLALPLSDTWVGTLDVVALDRQRRQSVGGRPWKLAVTGSRTVTVGAGTFDAWVLRGHADVAKPLDAKTTGGLPEAEVWIAKKGGWLLRWERRVVDTDGSPWTEEAELQTLQTAPASQR